MRYRREGGISSAFFLSFILKCSQSYDTMLSVNEKIIADIFDTNRR